MAIATGHCGRRAGAVLLALALSVLLGAGGGAAADELRIDVLSNRADLVSGGDALVEIVIPPDVSLANVRVSRNGVDVTSAFAVRPDGRFVGLVTGLVDGANDLRAHVTAAPTAKLPAHLTVQNHPIGGPVISGAQLQPWVCARPTATPVLVTVPASKPGTPDLTATVTSRASGLLDGPLDAQCNASTRFDLYYQPKTKPPTCTFTTPNTAASCLVTYDPANPPAADDVADFTNDRGDTVKSIVVHERGTANRGMYQIATFYDPTKASAPWAPQRGWNGKLLWRMGASGSVSRFQTAPGTSVFNDNALRRGFMVASSSLTDHGTNSNDTFGAEMMVMVKEHIRETYGDIRYTIGDGCSGGSIMQHSIAGAYPGLLDAIQPNCSYSDSHTVAIEIEECGLLQNRYYATADGSALTLAQRAAINGHLSTGFCNAWITSFLNFPNPSQASNCGNGWPASLTYSAANQNGVRCDLPDHQVGMVGTFVDTDGNTKAIRPMDNEGVQYGLKTLRDGVITAEQFVRLNEGVGSYNNDFIWTGPSPSPGMPAARQKTTESALEVYYSGGLVSDGRQLAKLPIIDLRGNQAANGDIHMNWRAWATRDRLDRDYGEHQNHLIWAHNTSGGASAPGAALTLKSFLTLDQWLSNIEADTSDAPIEQKVRANKPAAAVDFCLATNGATDAQLAVTLGLGDPACPVKFQSSPRQVAGGPLAENIFKCQRKPLDFDDPAYGGVTFTSEQQARLQATFPTGVCDWSKPGVGQVPEVPFATFATGPGGQALGDAPLSSLGPSLLTAFGPAKVWVGLKNSDDVGTSFDLQAKVYKNDAMLIGSGQLNGAPGGGSGFNNARLDTIALSLLAPVEVPSGTKLSVKLLARIACNVRTHASGTARFWFNDAQAASMFSATIDGDSMHNAYYMRSGGALGGTQGLGPKAAIDVGLNSRESCAREGSRTFTEIGTWSVTVP